MALSATDKKAILVDMLERALQSALPVTMAKHAKVEVKRLSNLQIQAKVDWKDGKMPSYYLIKVSEPW